MYGDGMFRHLFLDYLPETFPFTTYPLANHRSYRFPLPEQPGVAAPGWFTELPPERPLVYMATGTFAEPATAHLVPAAIEALADLDCATIVVTGPALDPGALGRPGPHMRVVPWMPQALVLPSVDVFVTHGGINSIREAIQCAVPMVVTPITADQPHNAECVSRHGLGESIPADEVTAAGLQAAVRHVLGQSRYAHTARRAQRHVAALPDLDAAVDDLERLTR
jgi:N-glycosyltransferase